MNNNDLGKTIAEQKNAADQRIKEIEDNSPWKKEDKAINEWGNKHV